MKKQLLGALISKFQEFSKEFQMVQVNISKARNERTIRQALIYDRNLTEEEVNRIREDPDVFFYVSTIKNLKKKLHEVFLQKMNGSTNVFLENFVSDIQDKYSDIKKLEQVQLSTKNSF